VTTLRNLKVRALFLFGVDHGIYVRDAAGSMRLASGYEETMKQWVLTRLR
jgi:hypothetical protein